MRKIHVFALVAICMLGVFFSARWLMETYLKPPPAVVTTADPEQVRIGEAFLDALDAGRWDEALAMTTPEVRAALADGKLEKIWESFPKQLGERQSRSPLRGELVAGIPVVTSTLVFGLTALDARIVVDGDGQISGFRLVPGTMPEAKPAPLAADAGFAEIDFPVGASGSALPGTLALPQAHDPVPAIVLVHGSGPQDRNETIGPNAPFRDLARGLAEQGIAVLRYEKRTKAQPEAFAAMDFTVDEETVDDAVIAVNQLLEDSRINPHRVFVAGHSLGAMMAPRIAQRAPGLAGLILLAPTARPLQDVVLEQVRYLADADGEIDAEEQAGIDEITTKAAAVATLAADTPASETLLGLPARYWIDLRQYDPVTVARELPQPILIVQGGRDYQVTPDGDFARWQAAFADDPRVQLRLFPALNHLLIAGEGPSLPGEYAQPGTVDPAVIQAIAVFVAGIDP